jgi:VanZ family protein
MIPVFRAALWVCVVAVGVLAFAPLEHPVGFSYDKTNHSIAFLTLAWLADGAHPGRERAAARWALLLGYGLLIELVQHFLPYRAFSWLDFAADGLGALAYSVLAGPLGLPLPAPLRACISAYRRAARAGRTRSEISSAKASSAE